MERTCLISIFHVDVFYLDAEAMLANMTQFAVEGIIKLVVQRFHMALVAFKYGLCTSLASI